MERRAIEIQADRRLDGDKFSGALQAALVDWAGFDVDVSACIQCGTCSAACEAIEFMELGPRKLMRLTKFGFVDEALQSADLWACTGCQLCTTRCPWGVRVSDVMDALKGLAIQRGIQNSSVVYHQAYMKNLKRHGILSESELVMDFAMRTAPLRELWRQRRMGLKLLLKRKSRLLKKNLNGLPDFKKMLKSLERDGRVQG